MTQPSTTTASTTAQAIAPTIQNLDLDNVIARLRRDENMSTEDIQQAVKEYKQFLELRRREDDANIVPSVLADKVWHHHILDTRTYARDCDTIFGDFLHHNPNVETPIAEKEKGLQVWRRAFGKEAPKMLTTDPCI